MRVALNILRNSSLVLIMCLLITGCGFHLRGSLDIPESLKTVYISPYEPYEPFQAELRCRLLDNNVKILNSRENNVTVLEVSRPNTNEEALAFSSSGEVQRFRLILSVSYSYLPSGDNAKRIHRTITRTRELNRTNNMLLSNEGEIQIVKRDLLNEAVTELLRQITARPSESTC